MTAGSGSSASASSTASGSARGPRTLREDLVELRTARRSARRRPADAADARSGRCGTCRFEVEPRRGRRHHRPQRRRQEHAAQDPVAGSPSRPTGGPRSRAGSARLLEVGTGFHPELTGRENIYLNGAILGMTRARDRPQVRRDRRLRRGRAVPRHAGEALLERHVRAAGVRRGRAPRAGDPDRRRGAGGRRRASSRRSASGKMRTSPGRRADGALRQPQHGRRAAALQRAVLLERGRAVAAGPTADSRGAVSRPERTPRPRPGAWIDLSSVERSGQRRRAVHQARYWSEEDAAAASRIPDGPLTVEPRRRGRRRLHHPEPGGDAVRPAGHQAGQRRHGRDGAYAPARAGHPPAHPAIPSCTSIPASTRWASGSPGPGHLRFHPGRVRGRGRRLAGAGAGTDADRRRRW